MQNRPRVIQKNLFSVPNGKYYLGDNLILRVRGNSRTFFFRFFKNGKSHEMSLGSVNFLSISDARIKIVDLKAKLFNGENVLAEKEKKTFILFSDAYEDAIKGIERSKKWENPKHSAQWLSTIKTYALPILGKLNIDDITREDIFNVLSPIWETKTETASRVRGRLENIFDYFTVKGIYTHENPARWKAGLSMLLPPPRKIVEVKHQEAMTFNEARDIARQFFKSESISHKAILFGMLTASRANEFQLAEWSEVDFKTKTWQHMRRKDKKKYPHRVPLSDQCIKLLKSIPRGNKYIFHNEFGNPLALDTFRTVLRKNVKRAVTMHGCRSTFNDWAAENNFPRNLIQKSLMHTLGNKVEEAYQRSDLLEQRRALMQAWADALTSECKNNPDVLR